MRVRRYLNSFLLQSGVVLRRLYTLVRQPIFLWLTILLHSTVLLATWLFHLLEQGTNPQAQSLLTCFYWAIGTITTVGYGDVTPQTDFGKWLAIAIMLLGSVVTVLYTALFAAALVSPEIQTLESDMKRINRDMHDDEARMRELVRELNDLLNRK
jgi:voltage-gated potassium channel